MLWFKEEKPLLVITILFIFFGVFATGCFQSNRGPADDSQNSKSTTVDNTSDTNGTGLLNLVDVVRSNLDPNSLIELIGEKGEIGATCGSVQISSGGQASSLCSCRFKWTEVTTTGTTPRQADVTPIYSETDLLRCPSTGLSNTAQTFEVSVAFPTTNASSNSIQIAALSFNSSLDPSVASNYVQVQRYLCRDHIINQNTSLYVGSGGAAGTQNTGLLDPNLWDSASYAYSLYTSSFGLDYGAVAMTGNANLKGFECPTNPNSKSIDPLYDLTVYSMAAVDLNNPLRVDVPDGQGDKTIFPPDDNLNLSSTLCDDQDDDKPGCEKYKLNRYNYYLASFQNGTFSAPVCVRHTVANLISGVTLGCTVDPSKGAVTLGSAALAAAGKDIIGFAARPNLSQECPSTATLPAGKKWAKLWRFRASLPVRKARDLSDKSSIGDLFCTTRNKECQGNTPWGADVSTCTTAPLPPRPSGTFIGPQRSGQNPLSPTQLFGNCSDAAPGCIQNGKINCCFDVNAQVNANAIIPALFSSSGGNMCTPSLPGMNDATTSGASAEDVWLMGNGTYGACIEADTDNNGKLLINQFPDRLGTFILADKELETDSQSDILYVVSPTYVKTENVKGVGDSVGKPFIPQRILPNGTVLPYGLFDGSENTGASSARAAEFPLCVLQDAK